MNRNNNISLYTTIGVLVVVIISLIVYVLSLRRTSEESNNKKYEIVADNNKILLSSSDSAISDELVGIKSTVNDYLDKVNRFDVDTVADLSLASIALEDRARVLQKKLIKELPSFSMTTGIGDDQITRQYYIVEGDIKLDRDELYYYCLDRLRRKNKTVVDKRNSRKLTVAINRNGEDAIWPRGIALRYCVMRSSFSSKSAYESVVKDMRNATNDWMRICNITFKYAPELDKNDIDLDSYSNSDGILFVVRQLDANGKFIAQAFYPPDLPYKRFLLLDNTFFTSPYGKVGVIRHELGHILGFRHEHIWSKDTSCPGENIIEEELGAQALTDYDPYSVMHYPCGQNSGNFVLQITDFDKEGALKVYPYSN